MKPPLPDVPASILIAMRWAFGIFPAAMLLLVIACLLARMWTQAVVFAISFVIFLVAFQFTWHMTDVMLRRRRRQKSRDTE